MKQVHLMLQSKGGCGKSFIAVQLAQYLRNKHDDMNFADTDVANQTFSKYKDLNARFIETVSDGIVSMTLFDPLIKMMVDENANFLMDNGSSNFLPLTKYLAENDIYDIMHDSGKQIYMHCPLAGGGAADETYTCLKKLVETMGPHAKIIVWENEFWGPVEYGGKSITESRLYKDETKSGKIAGLINVRKQNADYNISAISTLATRSLTYRDIEKLPEFDFLVKNRIKKFQQEIFNQLDTIVW